MQSRLVAVVLVLVVLIILPARKEVIQFFRLSPQLVVAVAAVIQQGVQLVALVGAAVKVIAEVMLEQQIKVMLEVLVQKVATMVAVVEVLLP